MTSPTPPPPPPSSPPSLPSLPFLSLVGGNRSSVGKHILVRLSSIKTTNDLDTKESARKSLWAIANACQFTVVAENGFQFEPRGATYVLILAESHLSIHTYPERQQAYLDVFCCSPTFHETPFLEAIQRVYEGATLESFTILR